MRVQSKREALRRRPWIALSLIAALCLSVAACGSAQSGSGGGKTITIGALQPQSGPVKFLGDETLNGMKVAIKQINQQGGIHALGGAQLKLDVADSSSSDTSAATNAASQLLNDNPAAVMAPTDSTVVVPASTVFERAGIPQCTSSFADEITSRGYKTIFQLPTTATKVGETTADSLGTILPLLGSDLKKVAVLYDATNPSGEGLVSGIESKIKSLGLQIVYKKGFEEGLSSAAPLATGIKSSGAQVLVNGASAPTDTLVINKALSQQGVDIPVLLPGGGLATSTTFYKAVGDLVNGSFTAMQWNYSMNLSPQQNELLKKANNQYVSMFPSEPFMGEFAGEAYECTWLFAAAMEKAKSSDPADILKTLHSAEFSDGPASLFPPGTVKFNSKGLDERAVNIVGEWCHNKLQTVYPKQLATQKITDPSKCG